jgi:hypothetical protein
VLKFLTNDSELALLAIEPGHKLQQDNCTVRCPT